MTDDSTDCNREIIEKWSATQFSSWLLEGLGSKSLSGFLPIHFTTEPSIPRQIHYLFIDSTPHAKESIFKIGVAKAISEWSSAFHTYDMIGELAHIVGELRVGAAIPRLRELLKSRHFPRPLPEEAIDARKRIVRALCGFGTSPSVGELLQELLNDAEYKEHGGQLFLALCRAAPDRFPEYSQRFVRLVRENELFYDLGSIIRQFLGIVGPIILNSHFHELSEYGAAEFARMLYRYQGKNKLVDTEFRNSGVHGHWQMKMEYQVVSHGVPRVASSPKPVQVEPDMEAYMEAFDNLGSIRDLSN